MMKKQTQSAKSKLKKNLLKTSKSPKLSPKTNSLKSIHTTSNLNEQLFHELIMEEEEKFHQILAEENATMHKILEDEQKEMQDQLDAEDQAMSDYFSMDEK